MDFIKWIATEMLLLILGKRANEAIDSGHKKKGVALLPVFLLLVFGIGAYSLYWLMKTLIH